LFDFANESSVAFRDLARVRGVAGEVDAGEFLLEPGAFLDELFQRSLDGLDLLAFGRDVIARFRLLASLSSSLVATRVVTTRLGCGGRAARVRTRDSAGRTFGAGSRWQSRHIAMLSGFSWCTSIIWSMR